MGTKCTISSQQTRDIEPMLVQYWPAVYDVGPTLIQHWFNVSCLLGCSLTVNGLYSIQVSLLPVTSSPRQWIALFVLPVKINVFQHSGTQSTVLPVPPDTDGTRVSKCGQLSQKTRRLDPMLFQCWSSAVGGGPILKQH